MIKHWKLGIAVLGFAAGVAWAQAPVELGRYLVEGILTCGNCHSPRGPGGVIDTARLYAGGPQTWDTHAYTVKGSNITPDKKTGIGDWSADDIKRAIVDGRRPNGTQLSPLMPYAFYKIFTPADLDAVVAYLRSVPAVLRKVPAPVYKGPAMHVDIPSGAEKPMAESALKDPVKRGFYLVTIGHCMACHTPEVNERWDYTNDLGKGGRIFKGPFGVSVSRNITSLQGERDWRLERRGDQARDHEGRAQGRKQAAAADGLRVVCTHDRRGSRRDRRLPANRAAGRLKRPI